MISLKNNQLSGDLYSFMKKLPSLKYVDLSFNDFSGIINISLLSSTKGLIELDVSNNKRLRVESFHSNSDALDTSMNLSGLQYLNLSSCNIQSFPRFICQLPGLQYLDLSDNDVEGKVPSCLWSITGLENLVLDQNKINGFEEPVNITRPIGSRFDFSLTASSNRINGAIPSFLCNLTGGSTYLDMSHNLLTGVIPNCLYKLTGVELRKNHLWGQLPSGFCNMEVLDLNHNLLTGRIPKSLSNCTSLRALDLGNNEIDDVFPAWLGQLNNLEMLVLRSNHLYGSISVFNSIQSFPALTILDISTNHFSGTLPYELFEGLKAIMHEAFGGEDYLMGYIGGFVSNVLAASHELPGEVEVTIKGQVRLVKGMQWASNVIDLSNNNFTGQVPKEIGLLKNLRGLNVSNDNLDGPIPKSLGNLQHMEWLDLSRNHLSGTIPEELVALTFLSFLNLSYNDLQGGIPQGNQFNTFDPSSFEGNPKLCGQQVNRTCLDEDGYNVHKQDVADDREGGEEGWKYGSLGIGFSIGLITITLPIFFVQKVASWYWDQTGEIVDFISLQIYAFLNFGR